MGNEKKATEELNLDAKVTVRNLANWTVGFQRKYDGVGDVNIPPKGVARLTRNEVIAQVNGGNTLFNGVDMRGSHATVYIEDKPTRIECGYETEDGEAQMILTEDAVKELFKQRSMNGFEAMLKERVVTRAEKHSIIEMIQRLGINDYAKIRAVENYTGINI
jgi:hypothetical protein